MVLKSAKRERKPVLKFSCINLCQNRCCRSVALSIKQSLTLWAGGKYFVKYANGTNITIKYIHALKNSDMGMLAYIPTYSRNPSFKESVSSIYSCMGIPFDAY